MSLTKSTHNKWRRRLITVTVAALASVGLGGLTALPANAAGETTTLTVLSTTDLHGHVYNWDYFADKEYPAGKELGMARAKTIIDQVRASASANSVITIDNGDAIQGTPLTYLGAKQPGLLANPIHPMAQAFNDIGYDVQVLGNHEFNYGLDLLNKYKGELNAPLLGANVVTAGTDTPAFEPYKILDRVIDGHTVKVGVLGLVTPGVRIWDKAIVGGKLDFKDLVLTAQKYVPIMKNAGADVIIVSAHTGLDADGSVWNPAELQENVASSLATKVDGIDLVIGGHSHVDIPAKVFKAPNGKPVLFTQPFNWAKSVSQVTLPLIKGADDHWSVNWPANDADIENLGKADYTKGNVVPSPVLADDPILKADHAATVAYVNTKVATSTEKLSAEKSRYEDTPILDFIAKVQADTVREAIKGTKYEKLPVLAQVSPFSRTAIFPQGDVTIKDMAGLYIYDNTLAGVEITGKQLKEYLEYSARYFKELAPGATFDPEADTNALYPGATRGIPDYNYDAVSGVHYLIDIAQPVGQRIYGLSLPDGQAVKDDDRFILAVNNYRQNGGGGYPAVAGAPVVYDQQQEIRQLLIDHAKDSGVIDPKDFYTDSWQLITNQPAPQAQVSVAEGKAGEKVTATATGFVPGSVVKFELHSTPIALGSQAADQSGSASIEFTVPADSTVGEHTVVASSAPSGVVISASTPFAVVTDAVVPVDPTVPTDPANPSTGEMTPVLAKTGLNAWWTLLFAAGLLLMTGVGLLSWRNRKLG